MMQRREEESEADRHDEQRPQHRRGDRRAVEAEHRGRWCSVFHQSTENFMIGMLIAPTRVSIEAARAARPGSSIVRHSAISPR